MDTLRGSCNQSKCRAADSISIHNRIKVDPAKHIGHIGNKMLFLLGNGNKDEPKRRVILDRGEMDNYSVLHHPSL